jgi:hypothetical protein
MYLTREQILAKTARRYTVSQGARLQNLTELELSTLRGIWASRYGEDIGGPVDLTSRRELLVMCLVDANGDRLFTNDEVVALGALDGAFSEAIYEDAATHCGMRRAVDKEVTKLEKKSESTAD